MDGVRDREGQTGRQAESERGVKSDGESYLKENGKGGVILSAGQAGKTS